MRTSKPISTVSYNSESHLILKLNELITAHKISDWIFIKHKKETDEKKDHIHLWIRPNTLIDTMDLQEHFLEVDMNNPTKPLKCIDFQSSKIDDWILYNEHFKPYLLSKGQNRVYFYSREDFKYFDEDSFDNLYLHAHKGSEWAKHNQILQALNNEMINPAELILNGTIPLNMASNLNSLGHLKEKGTYRNGRITHTPKVDETTGEIIED